jgi:hypothetical protein
MNRIAKLTLTTVALVSLAIALPAGDALAQQKQRVSYKASAENSKYTQQHTIDVGDVPGHQVRAFEIYRTYPTNAPVFNGLKLKETWTRSVTDYVDGNGTSTGYNVYVLENGDKFFARYALIAQNAGAGKLTTTTTGTITGGTGKFAGIQGLVRSSGTADPKAGFAETQSDIEYWIEK